MSHESDQKDERRVRIFWSTMVGLTIILLGLKLCNVCNIYDILCYKFVFLPLYGPILIAIFGILCAIIVAIIKVLIGNLFNKK